MKCYAIMTEEIMVKIVAKMKETIADMKELRRLWQKRRLWWWWRLWRRRRKS
jgi:hypothetical protein